MSLGNCKLKEQRDATDYIPIKIAKIWNTDTTKCRQGCGTAGTLIHCWGDCKMVHPFWETVWQLLTKLNIIL